MNKQRTCDEGAKPGGVQRICGHAERAGEKRERGGGGRESCRGDLDEVGAKALGETDQVVLVHYSSGQVLSLEEAFFGGGRWDEY